jgi:hypothetical protein
MLLPAGGFRLLRRQPVLRQLSRAEAAALQHLPLRLSARHVLFHGVSDRCTDQFGDRTRVRRRHSPRARGRHASRPRRTTVAAAFSRGPDFRRTIDDTPALAEALLVGVSNDRGGDGAPPSIAATPISL